MGVWLGLSAHLNTAAYVVVAILGLGLLMVVHEGGHYLAARFYGMRVLKFSIGFGPTIWRRQPKDSPTTFQIGIIPFLAYVQIAGMNPYEEIDPNDKGSYANGSLWARIATIAAGPLANYLVASIFFFFGILITGNPVIDPHGVRLTPASEGPAQTAGILAGDLAMEVDAKAISSTEQFTRAVSSAAGRPLVVTLERNGERIVKEVTPLAEGPDKGRIRVTVSPNIRFERATLTQASAFALKEPARTVARTFVGIYRMITGKEKGELGGPLRMTEEMVAVARQGAGEFVTMLGALSAYLGAFNLLPIAALDGGRLMFLAAEAISRRRPNAKVEGLIHAAGLLVLLSLIAVISVFDVLRWTKR